jgi:hypothetical protein
MSELTAPPTQYQYKITKDQCPRNLMSVVLDYRHKYIGRLLITPHSSKQARQSTDVNKKPATINIRNIGNPPI